MNTKKLELIKKVKPWFYSNLENCNLCPRKCRVNRFKDAGYCNLIGEDVPISNICKHFGEEPPISGSAGSGTIFFTNCNMACVYCQNYQISENKSDKNFKYYSYKDLAIKLMDLQTRGAHNINLVSPTSHVSHIIFTLEIAFKMGLNIPIVYNTNSFDNVQVLEKFDGIIDVYLADAKYSDDGLALKYSDTFNYENNMKLALIEMYKQTNGDLKIDDYGIARRGMIIRHLIIPGEIKNSKNILDFILKELHVDIHLSLMSQYKATDKALKFGVPINRCLSSVEYSEVEEYALELGFKNGWFQEIESSKIYNPDFNKANPFNE